MPTAIVTPGAHQRIKGLEAKTGHAVVSASNNLALKARGAAALSHLDEVVPVARIAAPKKPPAPRKRTGQGGG